MKLWRMLLSKAMSINLGDFESDLKPGKDKYLEKLKRNVEARSLDDILSTRKF